MKSGSEIFCALLAVAAAGCAMGLRAAEDLVLATQGHSGYAIVRAADESEAEAFAAAELAAFIHGATGADLPFVWEEGAAGGQRMYVGQTAFAAHAGIDFAELDAEEWLIRAVGDNVIIAGGRPRGTLYAVYEFLERCGGVRFLDENTTHVPSQAVWHVAADLDIRGRPAFGGLRFISNYGSPFNPKRSLFKARLRLNGQSYGRHLGFPFRYGRPNANHTFAQYGTELNEPEHWALNAQGRRVKQHLDFCQSNPEVRRHFAAQLREYIRIDREEIDKAGLGEPYPVYYDISANDAGDGRCYCNACSAVAETYGAYSGLLLEFINAIADDIAEEYPEIVIQTFAYKYTAEPPVGIRPRANVLIRMAPLTSDMPADGHEKLRPMEDPVNSVHRERIEKWGALSGHMGIWTYWAMFQSSRTWPRSMIGCLGPDMRFYRRNGVELFFTEAYPTAFYNFTDLTVYLGARLLQDPEQDDRAVVEEYLTLYYGAAAPAMLDFLDYLERRQRNDPGRMTRVPLAERKAFDRSFFIEADRLLTAAERFVADDAERLARVRRERIPVDHALLWLWNQLESQESSLPFDRAAVVERLRVNLAEGCVHFGVAASVRADMERTLEYLKHMPPVPSQFAGQRIRDITWPLFQQGGSPAKWVDDPAAAGGRALRLDATMKGDRKADEHDKLPEFGVFAQHPARRLKKTVIERDRIPADEAFHWYAAGRITLEELPQTTVWVHHSWMISPTLRVVANESEQDPAQEFEVHVSIKLEGPAYVPGSTNINALSVDRIILVEVAGDGER